MNRKKPLLLAPRNAAREFLPNADVDRMLASGSWLEVTLQKKPSRNTLGQRAFRERCRAQGYQHLYVVLSKPVFDALHQAKGENETMAELISRLLDNTNQNS